jgi:hypothetical protein
MKVRLALNLAILNPSFLGLSNTLFSAVCVKLYRVEWKNYYKEFEKMWAAEVVTEDVLKKNSRTSQDHKKNLSGDIWS